MSVSCYQKGEAKRGNGQNINISVEVRRASSRHFAFIDI